MTGSSGIELVFLCLGVVEPVEVADNGDQTHTVSYVPTREGPYSINVLYADEEIPRRYPLLSFATFGHLFLYIILKHSLLSLQPLQG